MKIERFMRGEFWSATYDALLDTLTNKASENSDSLRTCYSNMLAHIILDSAAIPHTSIKC